MKQKPSFQFYQQDFLGSLDVQMMTAEEVGCYCLLLFNCYNNGGKLPSDLGSLKILCRGNAIASKVLEKFYKDGDFLRHKRIDLEMRKNAKFSKTQSENAKKRWSKDKKETMPSQCHGIKSASNRQCSSSLSLSSTSNKEIYKEKVNIMTEKEFEIFWNTYPRKIGKGIAQDKFLKLNPKLMDTIISAIEKQKKLSQWQDPKYIPHPATWLNQQRWLDEFSKEDEKEDGAIGWGRQGNPYK